MMLISANAGAFDRTLDEFSDCSDHILDAGSMYLDVVTVQQMLKDDALDITFNEKRKFKEVKETNKHYDAEKYNKLANRLVCEVNNRLFKDDGTFNRRFNEVFFSRKGQYKCNLGGAAHTLWRFSLFLERFNQCIADEQCGFDDLDGIYGNSSYGEQIIERMHNCQLELEASGDLLE